jgi:hypothetical protein
MQNDITNYFKNFISAWLQLPFYTKTNYSFILDNAQYFYPADT